MTEENRDKGDKRNNILGKKKEKSSFLSSEIENQKIIDEIVFSSSYDKTFFQAIKKGKYSFTKEHFEEIYIKCNIDTSFWNLVLLMSKNKIYSIFDGEEELPTDKIHFLLSLKLLFNHALKIFDKKVDFKKWLKTPNQRFNSAKPIRKIESFEGIKNMDLELSRIEHGIL